MLRTLCIGIWDVISLAYLCVKIHGAVNLKFVNSNFYKEKIVQSDEFKLNVPNTYQKQLKQFSLSKDIQWFKRNHARGRLEDQMTFLGPFQPSDPMIFPVMCCFPQNPLQSFQFFSIELARTEFSTPGGLSQGQHKQKVCQLPNR